MKIYLDILLLTNCIMTIIFLETLSTFTHTKLEPLRVFSAGCCGGLFSLIIVLDANTYFNAVLVTLLKFLGIVASLLIAMKISGFTMFFKYLIQYEAIRIFFTGITFIYWEFSGSKRIFVHNYTVYFDISLLKLVLAVITSYLILTLYEILRRKRRENLLKYEAVFKSGNYILRIPAISDSGNKLCDSFTGTPVVIFYCDELYNHFELDNFQKGCISGFRILPYHTISGEGIIYATYKGNVSIVNENNFEKNVKCCVGILKSENHSSKAIFNPVILE